MNLFDNVLKVVYDSPELCSCDGIFFKVVLERATKSDNEKGIVAGDEKFLKFNISEGFKKFHIEYTSSHHGRYNNDKIPNNVFSYWQRKRLWWTYKAWLKDASFENFTNK